MKNQLPRRKHHRLRGYDYNQPGAYYVTLCTDRKRCLFGSIRDDQMNLSWIGKIVEEEWLKIPILRPNITLREYSIMPNHLHGIIVIEGKMEKGSLCSIVANFEAAVTRRVRERMHRSNYKVWQGDFYDHIIRDQKDWDRIVSYIIDNPRNWTRDPDYPG